MILAAAAVNSTAPATAMPMGEASSAKAPPRTARPDDTPAAAKPSSPSPPATAAITAPPPAIDSSRPGKAVSSRAIPSWTFPSTVESGSSSAAPKAVCMRRPICVSRSSMIFSWISWPFDRVSKSTPTTLSDAFFATWRMRMYSCVFGIAAFKKFRTWVS